WCGDCPLRPACTTAPAGRVITIHPHEARLQQAKTAQRDPDWQQAYRATRPIVERKSAHFTRRPWGGRKARTRGQARIRTDVIARAGAINLARLARSGLYPNPGAWAIACTRPPRPGQTSPTRPPGPLASTAQPVTTRPPPRHRRPDRHHSAADDRSDVSEHP